MRNGLIITCPRHDDTTECLTAYSEEIINEAKAKNFGLKEEVMGTFCIIINMCPYRVS